MNVQTAKEILALYRPGTADAEDPSFAEALQLCERDPELKRWLDEHCAVYLALRSRFRGVAAPEGLRQQILTERKVIALPFWRRPSILAAAAAFVVLAGILFLRPQTAESGFTEFRDRMVGTAIRGYVMDLRTSDPLQIRDYLTTNQAPSEYAVSAPLQSTPLTGCAIKLWQGAKISMVCFNSGKPHPAGQANDLWLFVADHTAVAGAPATSKPSIAKVNRVMTASWSDGGRTYLLVADGDEAFIRKYLSL